MAKIRTGSLAGNIRGSIGADTFSQNRYGTYVRRRAIPTRVVNEYTTKVRSIFAFLVSVWQNLPKDVRDIWDTYAQGNPIVDSFGEQQILSGFNCFVGINTRLAYIGSDLTTTPPTKALVAPVSVFGFQIYQEEGVWKVEILLEGNTHSVDETFYCEGAYFTSAGKNYLENLYRFICIEDGEYSGASQKHTLNISTAWIKKCGIPVPGYYAQIRVCRINKVTGDMSVKAKYLKPIQITEPSGP